MTLQVVVLQPIHVYYKYRFRSSLLFWKIQKSPVEDEESRLEAGAGAGGGGSKQ